VLDHSDTTHRKVGREPEEESVSQKIQYANTYGMIIILGSFVLDTWKIPAYVVPDLEGCEVGMEENYIVICG